MVEGTPKPCRHRSPNNDICFPENVHYRTGIHSWGHAKGSRYGSKNWPSNTEISFCGPFSTLIFRHGICYHAFFKCMRSIILSFMFTTFQPIIYSQLVSYDNDVYENTTDIYRYAYIILSNLSLHTWHVVVSRFPLTFLASKAGKIKGRSGTAWAPRKHMRLELVFNGNWSRIHLRYIELCISI